MAFRGYELNLMLRVQDRASSRLRRVANDLGGVNRAAQMQRDMQRLSAAQTKGASNAEFNAAKGRLLGLKSANVELAKFNTQLARSVALGRITQDQSEQIAKNFARSQSASRLIGAGRTAMHVGAAGVVGGGIALAGLGAASSAFANLDTQAIRAATQTGVVGEDFNKTVARARELEHVIIGLSQRFPATASDMADASYDIFSSIDLQDKAMQKNLGTTTEMAAGLKLLTLANKAAVAGQTDLATSTNTMITVLNNFDPEAKDVTKTMNEMFAIIRFGRMDFAQFGDLMNSLAPAAKKSGQSLLQVGAAAAQITKFIPSQSQTGTAISRLLDVFTRKDFQEGLSKLNAGFDITDSSGRLLPLYDIITKIVKLNPDIEKGGADLNNLIQYITAFGRGAGMGVQSTAQARKALVLLVTGYKQYGETLKHLQGDNNEFMKSFEALSRSYGVRWQIFKNQLRALVLIIGEQAIPIFIKLGNWVQGLAERWQGLSGHTRELIVKIVAFTAIVSVLGGVLLTVFGGIAALVGTFQLLAGGAALAAAGWLGLAIAAGVAAAYIITHWEKVKTWWHAFWGISFTAIVEAALLSSLGAIEIFVANAISKFAVLAKGLASIPGVSHIPGVKGAASGLESLTKGLATSGLNHQLKAAQKLQDSFNASLEKSSDQSFTHGGIKGNKKSWIEKMTEDYKRGVKVLNMKDYLTGIKAATEAQKAANTEEKYGTKLAKQRLSALHSAQAQQVTDLKQYTDNLVSKFKEIEEASKSAFGELFQGPISQGPLGQIFSQINDLVTGFGAKPIATPIGILNDDLKAQMQNFNVLRDDYAKLLRRGAPKEFVQELQGQGMGAISQVQGLANATPGQLGAYVKLWQGKRAAIKSAAQADMTMTLNIWKSYGKGIAWQIIQGLASDESQAILRTGFEKYITSTFGAEMSKDLKTKVEQSVAEWMKENPKPKAGAGVKVKPIVRKPQSAAGGHTTNHNTTINASGATPGAVTAALNKDAHQKKYGHK